MMGGAGTNVDQNHLRTLVETYGIDRNRAEQALLQHNNDLHRAVEECFSEPPSTGVTSQALSNALSSIHPSSPINLHDEKELETAMKLTQMKGAGNVPAVEDDLSRALKASAMEVEGSGLSQEEIEMNKVIERSLQETRGDFSSTDAVDSVTNNPQWRKKEDGVPTGLKNIGNTCYFNSMLQTYYMLPEFRKAVLSFPSLMDATGDDDPNKSTIQFMKELQKLFVLMMYSNQKYVDPSPVLKNLNDKDGKPVSIGDQQDVADFNEILFKTLEKGFELGAKEGEKKDLIRRIFYGSGPEYLQVQFPDGTSKESHQDTEFSSLILPIGTEPSDLFSRIDASVLQEVVDYTDEEKGPASAQRCLWFKSPPLVLMLQESRVQFDIERRAFIKRESPVTFEKEIYLDRYLLNNKEETTKRRAIVSKWREELLILESELKVFTHFEDKALALDDAIQRVIHYYKEKGSTAETEPLLQILSKDFGIEQEKMNDLRKRINSKREEIERAYEDMKQTSYSLYAVWVHQGVAGTGHYWAFIREPSSDRWTKFNDMRVSHVDEETVMREAVGGYANASAYFLIYLDTNLFRQSVIDESIHSLVPEALKKQVEESNEAFLKELKDYELKHMDKFDLFCLRMQETQEDTDKIIRERSPERDHRTRSYYAFLESLSHSQLILPEIVRDTYQQIFDRGIEKDVGMGMYEKVEARVGKETLVEATRLAFEDASKPYREQHSQFQKVSQLLESGLGELVKGNYHDAIRNLVTSSEKDREIENEAARRSALISESIVTCLLAILQEAKKKFEAGDSAGTGLCRLFIGVTCNHFKKEEPVYQFLKEKYTAFTGGVGDAPISASARETVHDQLAWFDRSTKPALPFIQPTMDPLKPEQVVELDQRLNNAVEQFHSQFAELIGDAKKELGQSSTIPDTEMKDVSPETPANS